MFQMNNLKDTLIFGLSSLVITERAFDEFNKLSRESFSRKRNEKRNEKFSPLFHLRFIFVFCQSSQSRHSSLLAERNVANGSVAEWSKALDLGSSP